ncbi:E3 ubiquitin-protein ligase CCNB1IP1 [Rhinoraja longicauda]
MSLGDDALVCNFARCRARLSGFAWVTACSHVFCDQHGSGEFSRSPALCPACRSALAGKLDIVRTQLCPSEEYKAMVLAGLKPELVLDIAARALAFWTYQIHQERMYQEYSYSKAEGRLRQMEKMYTQQIQGKDLEVSNSRGEVSSLKKLLDEYKTKYGEMCEKLFERNRQYQRLQGLYDSLRLRSMALAGEGEGAAASYGLTAGTDTDRQQVRILTAGTDTDRPQVQGLYDSLRLHSMALAGEGEGAAASYGLTAGTDTDRPQVQGLYNSLRLRSMALAGEGEGAAASYGLTAGPSGKFPGAEPPPRGATGGGDFHFRPSFFGSPGAERSGSFFNFSPTEEHEQLAAAGHGHGFTLKHA